MINKKSIQLNQAFGAVLTLILVAILVIIAIVIFVSLSTSFAGTSTLSEVNETVDMSSNANNSNSVASASLCGFGDFGLGIITNSTGGETIDSGNYTTTAAGLITNLTSEFVQDWNVTWSGTWGSDACTASENMTSEFGNYTSLIGLVGTIIFLGLVIGVLVVSFAFGGRRV